jgi:MoaA/NifB/PqqE/SkfB family radical SAM enzyme
MENVKVPNIIITNVCKNGCKYCFAPVIDDLNSEGSRYMTLDHFRCALDFLKKSDIRIVRILGGEPFLHPLIKEFFHEVHSDSFFERTVIFTGGLFNSSIIQNILETNTSIVININEHRDYSTDEFIQLKRTLETLSDYGVSTTLAFNIYTNTFNPNYLIDICLTYGLGSLRLSIAQPSSQHPTPFIAKKDYKKVGNQIFSLINMCFNNRINVLIDCVIPLCMFTDSQWGKISKLYPELASGASLCSPPIDISYNLKVTRCFSLADVLQVDLSQYDHIHQIETQFQETIDSLKWYRKKKGDNCFDCDYYISRLCQGGCLTGGNDDIRNTLIKQTSSIQCITETYNSLSSGNINKAVHLFAEFFENGHQSEVFLIDYIYTLIKVGNIPLAQKIFFQNKDRLTKMKNKVFFFLEAILYELQGNTEASISAYRKTIRSVEKSRKAELYQRIKRLKEKQKSLK